MSEQRIRSEMLNNSTRVNIFWNSPTHSNMKNFKPISFAARRGLLGYRLFIVHKDLISKLDGIKTLKDLQKYSILQGQFWDDINVLKFNNLNVIKGSQYEGLFKMINNKRADLFSRGINEIFDEVKIRKNELKNIQIENRIMLYYDWPSFMFVSKNNKLLKERLEYGFLEASKDGTIEKHFKKWYGSLIRNMKQTKRYIIKLKNPYIAEEAVKILRNSSYKF